MRGIIGLRNHEHQSHAAPQQQPVQQQTFVPAQTSPIQQQTFVPTQTAPIQQPFVPAQTAPIQQKPFVPAQPAIEQPQFVNQLRSSLTFEPTPPSPTVPRQQSLHESISFEPTPPTNQKHQTAQQKPFVPAPTIPIQQQQPFVPAQQPTQPPFVTSQAQTTQRSQQPIQQPFVPTSSNMQYQSQVFVPAQTIPIQQQQQQPFIPAQTIPNQQQPFVPAQTIPIQQQQQHPAFVSGQYQPQNKSPMQNNQPFVPPQHNIKQNDLSISLSHSSATSSKQQHQQTPFVPTQTIPIQQQQQQPFIPTQTIPIQQQQHPYPTSQTVTQLQSQTVAPNNQINFQDNQFFGDVQSNSSISYDPTVSFMRPSIYQPPQHSQVSNAPYIAHYDRFDTLKNVHFR